MLCPDGTNCGPEACSPDDNDFCAEIEIFDENSTCNATHGAGDYTAYVIADAVCRMDGSGRSYYALQCAEGKGYGVIGCNDCLCSEGCQDIGVDGIPLNTCYQEDWLDNLQIAILGNETKAMCGQAKREIIIDPSCPLTQSPTTTQPTNFPTYDPTKDPVSTTDLPTEAFSTYIPTQDPTEDDEISCTSDEAQNCAHCQTYAPCLNSVDPHCITHDALDCLQCETYAVCHLSDSYRTSVIIFCLYLLVQNYSSSHISSIH